MAIEAKIVYAAEQGFILAPEAFTDQANEVERRIVASLFS